MAKFFRKTDYTPEQMKEIKEAYHQHMREGLTHDCFRVELKDGDKCSFLNLDMMFKLDPALEADFMDYKIDQYAVHQKWGKAQILGQINGNASTYKLWMSNVHGWRMSDKQEQDAKEYREVVSSNAMPFER